MRELRVVAESNANSGFEENVTIAPPNFVTVEQLDTKIDGVVEKIANRLEPASALTPEVRGMVKAVGEVQSLRTALKDPTSAGIEEATSNLVTTVLGNALQNMTGGGQQAAPSKPLKNTLAEIAVHNLTGETSPLPQILDALTTILGKDKVREGYDAGMRLVDQQQNQSKLPNIILQLDENSQEDVVLYAQQQGYTDVGYAQQKLIEHKNMLLQEVEEYQRVQQGGQQAVAEEPVVEKPIYDDIVYDEPVVAEPAYQEPVEEPVIETHVEPVEKPVMKADKVIMLHSEPRTLVLAENKKVTVEDSLTKDSLDEDNDNDLDINNIIYELGEQDEQKKT